MSVEAPDEIYTPSCGPCCSCCAEGVHLFFLNGGHNITGNVRHMRRGSEGQVRQSKEITYATGVLFISCIPSIHEHNQQMYLA
jgi:hypothetical protein